MVCPGESEVETSQQPYQGFQGRCFSQIPHVYRVKIPIYCFWSPLGNPEGHLSRDQPGSGWTKQVLSIV